MDTVDETMLASTVDLSDARVLLVGHDSREAATLEGLLGIGGVGHIGRITDPSRIEAPDASGRVDLLILDGRPGTPSVLEWARLVPDRLDLDRPFVMLTAPHMAYSALQLDQSAFPMDRFLGKLTVPVSARRLWDFVAVATGLMPKEKLAVASGAVQTFFPPDARTARDNNAMVLVAEDNPTNQVVIARVLGRLGIAHEIAEDGKVALSMLAEQQYDLLLSDFHMPEMDGFELTKQIREREDGGTTRLPIVALTADVLPETARQCEEVGMDGYLRKPIEIDRLETVLRDHVPRAFEIRALAGSVMTPSVEAPCSTPRTRISRNPLDLLKGVDPDIFDPHALDDAFGSFDDDATSFVLGFLENTKDEIGGINDAFDRADFKDARGRAHAMKGASMSAGFNRLGRLMSDIQDSLDADDIRTAEIYREELGETYSEASDALIGLTRTALPGTPSSR